MEKRSKLKRNLIYQSGYRLLTIITPLITSPYLARVLGAEKLGIYSYTLSIVSYFTMIAFLGTETYGNRTIAQVNTYNDKDALSRTFWGIYIGQAACSTLAVILYMFVVLLFVKNNKYIFLLQGMWIISTMLDINWFFFGIEEVKLTVIRNALVKIIGIGSILLFVKSENDLWIYTLIMAGTMVMSQIIMWMYIPKYISKTKISFSDVIHHFKPNIGLFIPLIASSVYWTMDKTMLGLLSTYESTGYYYNADKVMNIPLNLVIGFGAVMLPRMSALIEKNDKTGWKNLFKKTSEFYFMSACAIGGGIAAVANEFVPIFFGNGYDECVLLIELFGPILVLKAINDLIKNQCILPLGEEKKYTIIVSLGAMANLIANLILIPRYGALGALIGTGVAEIVVVVFEFLLEKKYLSISLVIAKNYWYVFISTIMYVLVRSISCILDLKIIYKLCVEVIIGILIYLIGCLFFWRFSKESSFSLKKIVNKKIMEE